MTKICVDAFNTQKSTLAGVNLRHNTQLAVELAQNFCDEEHCDATMETFWSVLAEKGATC